jgi:RNA polymerase sigma-70 factor (ECF subfamily)
MNNIKESHGQGFFETAFNLYYERVVLYIYRYCKDWSAAENIAQDTYITFWENITKVDADRIPLPYLLYVARNKTINYLNRETVRNKYKDQLQDQDMVIVSRALESSTMISIYSREIELLVSKSMEEMTPKTKEFFSLSRFKCLKNEEIAQIQGVSVKTVEYRIMSALRILRKNLKDFIPNTVINNIEHKKSE